MEFKCESRPKLDMCTKDDLKVLRYVRDDLTLMKICKHPMPEELPIFPERAPMSPDFDPDLCAASFIIHS